jgi:hypothetical protein
MVYLLGTRFRDMGKTLLNQLGNDFVR